MGRKRKVQFKTQNEELVTEVKNNDCSIEELLETNTAEAARQNMLNGLQHSSELLKIKKSKIKTIEDNMRKLIRSRKCKFTGTYGRNKNGKNKSMEVTKEPEIPAFDYDEKEADKFFHVLGIRRIKPFKSISNV